MNIDRRMFASGALTLAGLAIGGCAPNGSALAADKSTGTDTVDPINAKLGAIESQTGGTLGVQFIDVVSGRTAGINRDVRFAHASSFKLSLAALLLARHAKGEIDADKLVRWDESDMMRPDTFTRPRLETGASLRELARGTQTTSDNPAANILLRELGGPASLTAFWRSLGDDVSRLDRNEPTVNLVPPGEVRDTTTPAAMAKTVAKLIYGDALPQSEQTQLKSWMVDTVTGLGRVRAGIPESWLAGDKTGTGLTPQTGGTYIDIGFVEPPKGNKVVFASYFRPAGTDNSYDRTNEQPLALVGEVLGEFAAGGPMK